MNRTSVGLIALFLLAIGAITWLNGPSGANAQSFAAGCIRVGLVLGALWLALPQIKALIRRMPSWLWGWAVGRGKKSETNDKTVGQQPRPKRPRRRSNA